MERVSVRHHIWLIALVAFILLPFPSMAGQSANEKSGSFVLQFQSNSGTSMYTVQYSYPTTVVSGNDLNITALVEVNDLSNLKLYLIAYELQATIFLSNGVAISSKLLVSATDQSEYLYAGSHWGPVEVRIQVNDSAAGIPPGGSVSGYVSLRFIAEVWYDQPIGWYYPESDARSIGDVTLTSSRAAPPDYTPYLGAAVVAVGAFAALWFASKRIKSSAPKSS